MSEQRIVPFHPTWQMKEAGAEVILRMEETKGMGLTMLEYAEGVYMAMLKAAPDAPERKT